MSISAKGAAFHTSLGQRPRERKPPPKQALKARFSGHCSIPYIALVVFDTVFAQELAIFFLKSAAAVVVFLGLDVSEESVELARANRKGAVATLPVKVAIIVSKALDPLRGFFLQPFEHFRLGEGSW